MSFLGYIGKSLGAGSAPIAAGLKTAQAGIDYREYRDDAPNRQRTRELQMGDLERAERTAAMTEEDVNAQRSINQQRADALRSAGSQVATKLDINPEAVAMGIAQPRVIPRPTAGLTMPAPTVSAAPTGVAVPTATTRARNFDPASIVARPPSASERAPIEAQLNEVNREIARLVGANVGGATLRTLEDERNRLRAQLDPAAPGLDLKRKILPYEMFGDEASMRYRFPAAETPPQTATSVENTITDIIRGIFGSRSSGAVAGLTSVPAAQQSATPRVGAQISSDALARYDQYYRPTVEILAPRLGMDSAVVHDVYQRLGYGESRMRPGTRQEDGQHEGGFQLSEANRKEYGPKAIALGYDPNTSEGEAAMAILLMENNQKALAALGVEATPNNLIIAHNQGPRGAWALLNHPDMPAAQALDEHAPVSNQPGIARVGGQAWMKQRDAPDPKDISARDFIERLNTYYGSYSFEYSGREGFRGINSDIYKNDPDQLTLDQRLAYVVMDNLRLQEQDAMSALNWRDTANFNEQVNRIFEIRNRRVEMDGISAQLEVTKGINQAMGGDTSYLNAVLSSALATNIKFQPVPGQGEILYQLEVGGQLIEDPMSHNDMKTFTMRIVSSEYDAALRQSEATLSETLLKAEIDRRTKTIEMDLTLRNRLIELETAGQRDAVIAILNNALGMRRDAASNVRVRGVGSDANNNLVVSIVGDDTPYIIRTNTVSLDRGQQQTVTSLEPIR